jgi:conjugal transfer pilus assembly protein TraW
MRVILSVLLTLYFNIVYASSFDAIGKTYDITETNALSWIASRLNEMEKNGEIAKQNELLQQKAFAAIERPKKVEGLHKTTLSRVFEHDLTVTVPHDITDYDGNIIHSAGTKVNPLQTSMTQQSLLFFDGDDNEQVTWALNEKKERRGLAKLVLVNGSVAEVSNSNSVRVFFDQAGRLVSKFGIKQVPAIVEQRGQSLMISEVKL